MNSDKPLWKVSIVTSQEAEDAVGEMMGRMFPGAVSSYFDFETKQSQVTAYIPVQADRHFRNKLKAGLKDIRDSGLDIGVGRITLAKVRPRDWAESWKRHFRPIEIGKELLLRPGWSKKRPKRGQAEIVLDPGLSFGTGHHPTTEYCLSEIVRRANRWTRTGIPKNGQSLLDLGTGSGILAIAAAKLGYAPVRAIDNDADAVRIARLNAASNGVNISIVRSDVRKIPTKKRFDFICANLISGLLINERRRIAGQLKRDGILVVAGILKTEFSIVQGSFEELGMKMILAKSQREWRSGSFCFA